MLDNICVRPTSAIVPKARRQGPRVLNSDEVAFSGQVGALAAATAALRVVAWATAARLSYLLAGTGALVGVIVGASQAGSSALARLAAAGLGVFLLVGATRRLLTFMRAHGDSMGSTRYSRW